MNKTITHDDVRSGVQMSLTSYFQKLELSEVERDRLIARIVGQFAALGYVSNVAGVIKCLHYDPQGVDGVCSLCGAGRDGH